MFVLAFAESIQLFPDGTLFIHIALILVMIWVLNRTLFRPINQIIDAREKQKGGAGGEAADILKNVLEKEAKYSGEMLDARSQGYALIENEQNEAAAARAQRLGEIKAEVADSLETGRAELAKQTADARASIGADADRMADQIAASILKG